MHNAYNSLCTGLAEALLGRIRRDIDLDLTLDPMCGSDLTQLHELAL